MLEDGFTPGLEAEQTPCRFHIKPNGKNLSISSRDWSAGVLAGELQNIGS